MKKSWKILGNTFTGLISLMLIVYGFSSLRTEMQMNRIYQVRSAAIKIPNDSASIAWGKHIVETHGCQKCHGDDLGGRVFLDDLAWGRAVAPNLTGGRGGVQPQRCAHDWVRAIRHGIGVDSKPLLVMPSQNYYFLSDEDLGDVIAYLQQVPPVDHQLPALRVGPLARVLYQFGKLDVLIPATSITHEAPRPDSPPSGVTPEYGRYLVQGNCQGCHGENLTGGPPLTPGFPPVANLTKAGHLTKWQKADFLKALRTGQTPEGKQLSTGYMPWHELGKMTDTELRAVWPYLRTLN